MVDVVRGRKKPKPVSLTDTYVSKLKPDPKGNYTRWQVGQRGFGVQVTPNSVKTFVFKCTLNGRQKWLTIGQFPEWNAAKAKDRASELRRQVDKGIDPKTVLEAEKNAPLISGLAKRYLSDHVLIHNGAKTHTNVKSLVNKVIVPELGNIRVKDLTAEHVQQLVNGLKETPIKANRTVAALSKMCDLAERWKMRPQETNPCRHVDKFPEMKRERYLNAAELQALGAELSALEVDEPYQAALIRLLILTGARLSEILTLKWEQVDLERRVLVITNHKTKRQSGTKYLPLNGAALEVLGYQFDEKGEFLRDPNGHLKIRDNAPVRLVSNPYVIVGRDAGKHFNGAEKVWQRLRESAGVRAKEEAEKAGLDDPHIDISDVRIHDLRHSFASVGAGAGFSLPLIGGLLGHSQASTTQRYAHLANSPLMEASETISEKLAGHLSAKKAR